MPWRFEARKERWCYLDTGRATFLLAMSLLTEAYLVLLER